MKAIWNEMQNDVLCHGDVTCHEIKKLSDSKWGTHFLLPCPAEKEIERLFKNGVRMWETYRREFVVSEEEMGPKVLVALIAHHTPTVMSDNGS
jgi:hypothetical protein